MQSSSSPLSLIHQPQQERSRETMQQILDAAADILETKTYEQMTISEIVQQAGCSVGALYGRFKDKDAILQALDQRFFQVFEERVLHLMSPANWTGQPIRRMVGDVIRLLVETYGAQRGTLRSLNLKARLYADPRFQKREMRAWNELFPQLQHILMERQSEFTHPNPALAIRLGFQQAFYATREILLWEPLRGDRPYDPEWLIAELTRAFLAYLGVQEEPNERS